MGCCQARQHDGVTQDADCHLVRWMAIVYSTRIALQFRGLEVNKRNDLHQRVTHKYTAVFTKDTGFL